MLAGAHESVLEFWGSFRDTLLELGVLDCTVVSILCVNADGGDYVTETLRN